MGIRTATLVSTVAAILPLGGFVAPPKHATHLVQEVPSATSFPGQSSRPGEVFAWGTGKGTSRDERRWSDEYGLECVEDVGYAPPCDAIDVPAEARSDVTAIAAGSYHALALKGGRVIAWGDNEYGNTVVPQDALSGVSAIAAGGLHSLALKNGRVIAWGWNDYGQTSVPLDALSGVTAIAAGFGHSLAIKDGRVIAWGEGVNDFGEVDVPPDAMSGVSAISADFGNSVALKDGGVIVWGSDMAGQLDVPVAARSGVTAIAGGGTPLALKDGRVIAWGWDDRWQATVPNEVRNVVAVAAGGDHSLALSSSGTVMHWGWGDAGLARVPVEVRTGVTAIAAGGERFSMAIIPPTLPSAPVDVSGVPGDGVVTVSWRPPPGNVVPPITRYAATASPGGRSCSTNGALSCTITGLENGTAYTFTVVATNQAGTSLSSSPSAPVTPRGTIVTSPGAVADIKAFAMRGRVVFTWSPPKSRGGAAFVTYEYRIGRGEWKATRKAFVTVQGAKGVRITLSVRAVNAAGGGPVRKAFGVPR